MACACKVNRDLEYLHKNFGTGPKQKKSNIREYLSLSVKKFFANVVAVIISFVFLPVILLQIAVSKKHGNTVNISKIVSNINKIFIRKRK